MTVGEGECTLLVILLHSFLLIFFTGLDIREQQTKFNVTSITLQIS